MSCCLTQQHLCMRRAQLRLVALLGFCMGCQGFGGTARFLTALLGYWNRVLGCLYAGGGVPGCRGAQLRLVTLLGFMGSGSHLRGCMVGAFCCNLC
jgi:hypothetical protein